jgi:hypothetical protein
LSEVAGIVFGIYSSQVVIEAERRLEDLMLDKCAFTIFGIVFRPE